MVKVDLLGLGDAIMDAVREASEEVIEDVEAAIEAYAPILRDEISKSSPIKTGGYASGWVRRKKNRNGWLLAGQRIYNKKKPRLTHILEGGAYRAKRGVIDPREHIQPSIGATQSQLDALLKK